MGTWPAFKAASFCSSLSTRMTSCPRSAKHAPATSPTYPDPTTAICIRYSGYLSENRFDNYFISFPAEVARITQRRPGQTSHRYVTTVTASAEATFCRPDADRPKFAEYRVPGSENSSHALAIFSRVPTSSRRKLFPFRSEPNATTVANTRMFAISNPASAHEYPNLPLSRYSIEFVLAAN